jgi:CubicO group peptidase (beta-lactamase class C family)
MKASSVKPAWFLYRTVSGVLAIAMLGFFLFPATELLGSETLTVRATAKPNKFKLGPAIPNIRFRCEADSSGQCRLDEFMDYAHVCALAVIANGKKRLELYNGDPEVCHDRDGHPNDRHRLYGVASVAKSITSTLVGQAIATRFKARTREEFQAVLDRPLSEYVGGLDNGRASAYSGVSLDSVLRMRSGVRWSEYGWYGLFSDANRFGVTVRDDLSRSIPEFARRYRVRSDGGHPFNYSALDAAIAGYVAETILGRKHLINFMEEGVWSQIDAQSKARWAVDKHGTAIGPCCFKATLDDLARFGSFVLEKGRVPDGRRQVIPQAWFELATQRSGRIDTIPRENVSQNPKCPVEYRYFWWLRKGRSDFTAIGRDGQFLHIYPRERVVIVQISDWKAWTNGDFLQCETFSAHDAIVAAASRRQ